MPAAHTTIRLLAKPDPSTDGWQARAECRKPRYPDDLFFPVGTSGPALDQVAAAKAVCQSCPVMAACRTWALEVLEYGVAGGLDEYERRGVRRDRAAARKAVSA